MAAAMRIERIETVLVDIPTTRTHHLSFAAVDTQNYAIVRVYADGLSGTGEASTIGGPAWGEESTEAIKVTIDRYLAPHLVGKDARDLNRLSCLMDTAVRGNRFAKAAVDMALHDLVARSRGEPLHRLLGGKVHDAIPVAWTLAAGDTAEDIAEAEEMLARRRHNIFKLKVGARDPGADLAHVESICRAVGDRASIRLDVNQAWDELTAARWIPRFADAGIELVEQPVAKWNHGALARLARDSNCAIMADESVDTVQSALELAKGACVDVFALKLTKSGGMAQTKKVAAIAEAAGIGLYGGCMLETALGTAAYAQCFATIPGISQGCELFGHLLLKDTITAQSVELRDFKVRIPDGPGIGVDLDEDKLDFYRRDRR
jgi:muconate/chloromuconate cycloisomerase